MNKITVLIATALIVAACGGGTSSTTFESLDSGSTGTLPPTSSTSTTQAGASTDTDTDVTQPPATSELPDSDYPDVVVADLAGGEFNLRELALESEPVLLWFWAPH